jgi:hypothetical protein
MCTASIVLGATLSIGFSKCAITLTGFGLVTATHECILLAKYCQYIIVQRKPTIWCDLGATLQLV